MNIKPDISIIIETLNYERGNDQLLTAVLEALQHQSVSRDSIEIIVVIDPIQHPGLKRHLEALDFDLHIAEAPDAHYYAQKNRGAAVASADVIGFIDSDCTPVSTWVETVLRRLHEKESQLAAVQGTVVTDHTIQGLAFAATSFGQVQGSKARPTRMLTGNNCAFRRSEFMCEPFDEAPWFHGPEVKKISAIISAGGLVLLEPGAEVCHAFYPGIRNFVAFSAYWGWCFLHLRRDCPAGVPYARLFDRLGWFAPIFLVPAKASMDTWRVLQQRSNMKMTWWQAIRCSLLLSTMAPIVGYGALLERMGRKPTTPLY